MRDSSYLLWHSIMNTYQIGSHEREPNQYVLVHNRFLGEEDDVFLVDKARLPGVIGISISQEIDSPAHSFSVTCEDKDGLLSPDYYLGKTPVYDAFRGHLNSVWKGQLKSNAKLEIHLGYGEQIVRIMTGLIDDVVVNAEAQTITVTGRSMYKRMIDNTVTVFPGTKYLIPSESMKIQDAINRAFVFAGVEFTGMPIVDPETGKDYLTTKKLGVRGETYDEVLNPITDSTFSYFYELPDGKVEHRELPKFSQQVEPVFTVDDKLHLTSLEYKYDDTDTFGTIVVESEKGFDTFTSNFITSSFLNDAKKEMVVNFDWANTKEKRKLAALTLFTMMLYKVRTVSISIPANPLLELYDSIRIQEKISTVSRNYHIRSIDYSFNSGGFTQTLACSINGGFIPPEIPDPPKPPDPPDPPEPPGPYYEYFLTLCNTTRQVGCVYSANLNGVSVAEGVDIEKGGHKQFLLPGVVKGENVLEIDVLAHSQPFWWVYVTEYKDGSYSKEALIDSVEFTDGDPTSKYQFKFIAE